MLKLGVLVVLLITAAGAAAFVPLHGRTVLQRWNAAHGPKDFLARGWAEATAALGTEHQDHPARQHTARGPKAPSRDGSPRPVEHHSESDRAALDRIIAEHATR